MFFFFKQKTAYEMRISDWSSDVCSSDLSQEEIDFWGEIVSLQDEHDDDVKIDGKWYVRNKLLWGRLRLTLAAHFGVHPNPDNWVMRVEQVGGLVKDAEEEKVRSEERRGGKEGVSTCRAWWSPYH